MRPETPAHRVFTKHYADPHRAGAAAAHHRWLTGLGAPTPRLLAVRGRRVDFEHITGHHVRPDDVPAVAELLGQLHAAAYRITSYMSTMDDRVLDGRHVIPGFVACRTATIRRRLAAGSVPDPRFTGDEAEQLLQAAADQPAAFYKDTNARNVLITTDGPVLIDFDDLTLAPFGYDLAKLLLTAAMTYGPLSDGLIGTALDTYNRKATGIAGAEAQCSLPELVAWIETHHILTSPYVGRHGYNRSWHTLRPW